MKGQQMRKKGLALLLSLTIVLSMMPTSVFADAIPDMSDISGDSDTVLISGEDEESGDASDALTEQGSGESDSENNAAGDESQTGDEQPAAGEEDQTGDEQPVADENQTTDDQPAADENQTTDDQPAADENQVAATASDDPELPVPGQTGWLDEALSAIFDGNDHLKVADYADGVDAIGTVSVLRPANYNGEITYESSNPSVVAVDSKTGKTTVKGVGVAIITISATAYVDSSKEAYYGADTAKYAAVVRKVVDFSTNPTSSVEYLAENGGSAAWDADTKTLTIKDIDYTAPKIDEYNEKPCAVYMPNGSTIVLEGENKIGFTSGETRGIIAVAFEGAGTIKASSSEGSLTIEGTMYSAIQSWSDLKISGGTINVDTTAVNVDTTAVGVVDNEFFPAAIASMNSSVTITDACKMTVNFTGTEKALAAICSTGANLEIGSAADVTVKTKDSIGLRVHGGSGTLRITNQDTSVYVDATNANAVDATDGGYYSDWSNITLISHGGYAVSAAQVKIASATYFCARGERGAINASSVTVPDGNVFLVSENFDGSNPSAKYDKTKVSTYKFVQTSKNQISWLRFTESQKTVHYLFCKDGKEYYTMAAIVPKEYAGTITYKSSDASIATVDANTGGVTINSKGKTGTVTITATGTTDSNISARAMTASYELTVTDPADFTINPTRAIQLLEANGGTATCDTKTKTLTLNGINYTAARITDMEYIGSKYAIYLPDGMTVALEGNNKIRFADGEENAVAGIGSEGKITFKGSGTLDIAGDMVCAVQTTGGGLDFQGGKYIFNTVNIHTGLNNMAAVYAAGNITIGSSVEMQITHTSASSQASGIYAGGAFENNGTLTINVQLKEGFGIHAKGNITFAGGKDVNITFSSNEASTEICGIYGEGATIQNVNANITLNGSAANGAHIRGIVGASGTSFINSDGSLTIELTGKNAEYGIATDTTNLAGGKVIVRCEGGTPVPAGMTIGEGKLARVGKAFNPTEREDYSVYTDDNAAEYKLFLFSASGLKENKITFENTIEDFKLGSRESFVNRATATNTETEIKYSVIEGADLDNYIVSSRVLNGRVILSVDKAFGKVTIMATQEESDEYEAASATYSFNVLPETDFSENPSEASDCLNRNWEGIFNYDKDTNTLTVKNINYDGEFPIIGDNMTLVVTGNCKIETSAAVALQGITEIRGTNDEASLTLSSSDNAVHLGNGGTKLTLQNITLDASTKNGDVLCVDEDNSTVEIVYSDVTLSGKSIVNNKINAINYNSDYIDTVASTTAGGNGAGAYDNSKIHTYKYFKATRKTGNAIRFETNTETVGYCDETFQSKLSKDSRYNGTVTYESSDTTIATVDNNGLVTINSDCKTGTVIITAKAAASGDFDASIASYELEIEDTADCTKGISDPLYDKPERAFQLLQRNGGKAGIKRGYHVYVAMLTVDSINYGGNIVLLNGTDYGGAIRAKGGTNILGSASKTITTADDEIGLWCDGGDIIINGYIDTCSTGSNGKLTILDGDGNGGNVYINGGLHASEINMAEGIASRIPNVTIANISKENFKFESGGKLSISSGTLTMTGELEAFLKNLATIDRGENIWMEVSTDIDGKNSIPISDVNDIDSSKLSTYKYFKASDQKVSDWLSFSKDKVAVSYSVNEASAVTPDIPTDYTAAGGAVTYTSSNPAIAAVNENTGAVTLNTEGKIGTVTITATAAETSKYNEATASCELTVLPIADFTANGERAAQILGTNTGTAAWDNDTKTLTITGISYKAEGAEFVDISEDTGIDTANAVILPDGATVAVSGKNTINGSSFESIVKFMGSGTINGDGTLSVTGSADANGVSPDNAICIGDSGKLTIDGKAFVNTEGANYGFHTKSSAKLHVNTGGIYAKGNTRALGALVDITYDEHVQITAAAGLDDQLGEYREGEAYRQIRAKYVAENEITFTNEQGNVDYCSTASITNPAQGFGTGKITYEVTEGADIVDVDENGKVTINKGRFGKVTITATQAADENYAEASAGYSFYVRGTADFDANSTRALQLLNTNGGGGTATVDSNGLTLENISYAVEGGVAVKYTTGNIIVKGVNSITSSNNIALELAKYHENAGKTIKGSGSGTNKLTLNTGGNTALDLSGVLTITDGVTVAANGKGVYTVSGNGSWGGIVIKNANLVITSATNTNKGGIVNSSTVPYIRYDVNEIKRMGGNSQASAKVDNSYTYWYAWHYFSATVKNVITAPEAYELSTTEKPLDTAGVTVSSTDINKLDTSYDGDLTNAILQYKNPASEDDTMLDKITTAGTYEVWLSMPTTDEYQPIAAASIGTLTVTKGTLDVAALITDKDQTKVYDGDIKSYDLPADLGYYDGKLEVRYKRNNEILTDVTNVGTYDVYVFANETANFEAIPETKIGTLTITGKEVPADDIFEEFNKTEIYDGSVKTVTADELTKKDEAYNGTVTISYKQGEETVETPTDAGTYDVYVSADAVGNYAAIAEAKVGTLTIDKKQLDSAAEAFTFAGEGSKQTVKYDGETRKAVIEKMNIVGYEDGVAKITYKQGETTVENPTELGTYTVYVSADETKNYKAIPETEMGTLEIVQGDGSLAFEQPIADFEYCDADKATFTNVPTGNGGKITYTVTKGDDIADVNAETGEVTVDKGHFGEVEITATQEATDNYGIATASYSFNVGGTADFTLDKERAVQLLKTNGGENANAKVRPENGWLELNNVTYNQPVKYGGDVLVVYNDVNITVDSGIAFESTYNTGNFKIRATGTLNLTTRDSNGAALKVRKSLVLEGDVSGPVNVNTVGGILSQNGNATIEITDDASLHYANFTATGAEGESWIKNSSIKTVKFNDKVIKAVVGDSSSDENMTIYTGSAADLAKHYFSATIKNTAPTKDAFTVTDNEATYDGNGHKATVAVAEGSGYDGDITKATIKYQKDGNKLDAATDAGTYTILLTMPATDNYQAINELNIGTFTIAKGKSTLAFAKNSITNVYYCLNNVAVNELTTDSTGKITYAVTDGTDIADVDAATGKVTVDKGYFGDVVITATQEADNNYEAASASYSFTVIGQADFECNAERALQLLRTNGGENCTAEWDADTKTLTIENLNYEANGYSAILVKASDRATLVVKGENIVKSAGAVALNLFSTVRGEGDGAKLTLVGDDSIRVNDSHKFSIQDITLIANGNKNGVYAYSDASVEIKNANVTISGAEHALFAKDKLPVTLSYDSSMIKAKASTNADGSSLADYDSSKSSTYKYVSATIKNAAPDADVFSVSENTATYDGQPHKAKVTFAKGTQYDGDLANAKIKYEDKNGNKLDAATNAGEYKVLLYMDATADYQAIDGLNVGTLTIAKATATADEAFTYEGETFAYDGNPKYATTVTKTDLVGYDGEPVITYKLNNVDVTDPTDVGEYEVWVRAEEATNYNAIETAVKLVGTLTITASAADISKIFAVDNVEATYDGKAHEAELKVLDEAYTDKGTLSYTDSEDKSVDAPINAGTYTVWVEAPAVGNNTAIGKTAIGTVTINKASATAAEIFDEVTITASYDGSAHGAALTSQNELYDGKWTVSYYKLEGEDEIPVEGEPVNAGTYNVHVSAAATNNYEAMADTVIGTVTIAKATATADEAFSYEDETFVYDGTAKAAKVTAKALINDFKETPVITYKKGGVEVTEPTEAGEYEVWVGAEASDNYEAIESAMLGKLTITEAVQDKFTISGTITSWDKDENAEIKLYDTTGEDALTDAQIRDDMRNNNGAKAIADYNGNCEEAVAGDKSGQYKQTFTISNVKAGTYKLAIFKEKRDGKDPYVVTVMDITVTDTALNIEEDINMWLYGDVNYDGRINSVDVAQIRKRNVGMSSVIKNDQTIYSIHQLIAADCNNDGKYNAIDVAQLQKRNVGMSSSFDKFIR